MNTTAMESRTFDLSVPVSRLMIVTWTVFGVIEIAGGYFSTLRGDGVFGGVQFAFGLIFLLFVALTQRVHRYVVTFHDAHLEIDGSLYRKRTIPWETISEVQVQLMKVEIGLKEGKRVKWNFNLSYVDNQIVKPQIIETLNEFAAAKGIPVRDSRS